MGTLVFRLMRILMIVAVASGALLSVQSALEQQMRSRPATETAR
jgi:uncharacterized membrane protein YdcZ (DUF606 family)